MRPPGWPAAASPLRLAVFGCLALAAWELALPGTSARAALPDTGAKCLEAPADAADLSVKVERIEDSLVIDVRMTVAVSPIVAWDVLTDFDHMSDIVSNLRSSRIVSRTGNTVRVAQTGSSGSGPIRVSFDTLRDIELMPHEQMVSRLVSGSVKFMIGDTQLVPHGSGTLVISHGEIVPGGWIPPGAGAFLVQRETRKQFEEFACEMLRRRTR